MALPEYQKYLRDTTIKFLSVDRPPQWPSLESDANENEENQHYLDIGLDEVPNIPDSDKVSTLNRIKAIFYGEGHDVPTNTCG